MYRVFSFLLSIELCQRKQYKYQLGSTMFSTPLEYVSLWDTFSNFNLDNVFSNQSKLIFEENKN